jgi:hypothetical protein
LFATIFGFAVMFWHLKYYTLFLIKITYCRGNPCGCPFSRLPELGQIMSIVESGQVQDLPLHQKCFFSYRNIRRNVTGG